MVNAIQLWQCEGCEETYSLESEAEDCCPGEEDDGT